jgi:uracil-DNA glycosylase
VPEPVLPTQLEWVLRYDGYTRLAASPEELERLLRSVRNSFATHGRAPDWCGVDLLRRWAFYLARADRHAGGGTLGSEWDAVLSALAAHPGASPDDRPPGRSAVIVARPGRPLPTAFSSEPKRHRDPVFLAAKRSRLRESHVAPINRFVDDIREEILAEATPAGGPPPQVFVPHTDPDSGGIAARVLFVLESPAGPAALGSGMLSADNNDGTAKNMWLGYEASGMPRTHGLHWNAVPWYVGDGKKNAAVTDQQVERGRRYLLRLLDLAPAVRVVVALGRPAQRSIAGAAMQLEARGIAVLDAPHPSPIPAAATRGASLRKVNATFAEALRIVGRD